MEIKGFIKQVLEARGGVSARTGNSWKIQSYVLETVEQYPRHLVFDVKNDNIEKFNIQLNEEMTVFFDVDANEYQGKWYNKITAWKVEKTGNAIQVTRTQTNQQAQPQPAPQQAQVAQPAPQPITPPFAEQGGNGLPF